MICSYHVILSNIVLNVQKLEVKIDSINFLIYGHVIYAQFIIDI